MEDKKKRLQWQCRRGMLEIDLLLKRYLSNSYSNSDEIDRGLFESLLAENDQQLFLWLTAQEIAPVKYLHLIEKLRQ